MKNQCKDCLNAVDECVCIDIYDDTPPIITHSHSVIAHPIHEFPDKNTILKVDRMLANTIGNALPPVVDMDKIKKVMCESMERVNAAARECALKSQYRHVMHPDRFEAECKTTFRLHNAQIIKADDLGGYIVNGNLVLLSERVDYDEIYKIDTSRYQNMPEIKTEPFESNASMPFWWKPFVSGLIEQNNGDKE